MNNNKQTVKNLVFNTISFLINFIISFFFTPYLIRVVGKEAYSFFPLVNNIIGYSSILTTAVGSMAGRFIIMKIYSNDIDSANTDIMMAFDECPPGQSDFQYAKKSLELTQRWLDRCFKRFNETEPLYGYQQSLFPIVQGCTFPELRREAAKFIADKGADGNAIGGLAVGEPTEVMYEMIEVVNEILPKDKPRYLMGVGTPQNILEAIERGVDMFDCVMPTRNGRNAMLFTYNGTMNMRNKKWEMDFSPVDPDGCDIDRMTTKAYLHHLFKAQELLAMQIASIHNLSFYLRLVTDARHHIEQGDFVEWKRSIIDQLGTRI